MLSPEEAHERLKAFHNPNHQQEQLRRVGTLWGKPATIGQVLIQAGPAWSNLEHNHELSNKTQKEVLTQLGLLKPGDRQKLFKALFPRLAACVEATWNLFDLLPYQTVYYRRPFRNPQHYSPGARTAWLQGLVFAVRGYDQDVAWLAAWTPYLGYGAADALGYLFAGAIEMGGKTGQEVYDILVASANGSHEIGSMGRHVVRGLLCASRPEGWGVIERLLLAAQREEGLRQVILEGVDEAHPACFPRLLRLILDHNLDRFSAAVRAFDVWFGLALEVVSPKTLHDLLSKVLSYLDNPAERMKAIQTGSAQEAYYALWAMAFEDALAALPHAVALRQSPDADRRFAATHLLAQMDLGGSFKELLNALDDPDLRIAARAVLNLAPPEYKQELLEQSDLFERLERLIARLPHKENILKTQVWDWLVIKLDRENLAGSLINCLGSRTAKRLLAYLSMMEPLDRSRVASLLAEPGRKDAESRKVLFTLAGDPSPMVREQALKALKGYRLAEIEIRQMESLLTRQAEDLRRGIFQLLLELPDKDLIPSIQRLLGQKDENQRRAGLELLRECLRAKRLTGEGRQLALGFKRQAGVLESEERILGEILEEEIETVSLDNALGLMNPENRSKPRPPSANAAWFGRRKKVDLGSAAAVEILRSLDQWVETHRSDPIELTAFETSRTELLGNVRFGFPMPDPSQREDQDLARLPLREVWERWWQTRPAELRDPDGFELMRACAFHGLFQMQWVDFSRVKHEVPKESQGLFGVRCDFQLHYEPIVSAVIYWLIRSHPVEGEATFLVDALEASLGKITNAELTGVQTLYTGNGERAIPHSKLAYLDLCRWHRKLRPEAWQEAHHARLWSLVRWLDEPRPGLPRNRPTIEDALYAQRAGAATRDDLLDLLLGPRDIQRFGSTFHDLQGFSGRKPHPLFKAFPILQETVEICRERILSIETRRGDLPTAASQPAMALRSIPTMKNLFRLLAALGNRGFERGYHFGQGRQAVLSHLIRVTYPLEEDTPQGFAELAHSYPVTERRLVELAMYAPQWSGFVESTLGWPRFREAVFWVYAHTKDRQWTVEKEIRELWAAQVSEYTPLSTDSLMDGAVDVDWFHQVYQALGEERWRRVYQAAELTANGNGHTRARIFADAMLGKLTSDDLVKRISDKRNQDSLRALGLVPLPDGENRRPEIMHRYEVMQEFLRTSRKFGSQRQASEKLAVSIGLENLARNAGYADPQRLEWAMEGEAAVDLAEGPVTVTAESLEVRLSINDLGEPELEISKNGKPLKTIPAALKKDEAVAGLLERKQKLERQASRMRRSLEEAMCRGDDFTGSEVQELCRHPVLRVMVEQLILVGPGGAGYPIENGRTLFTHSGQRVAIAEEDRLRIAHPIDLLKSGDWQLWQHECFIAERIQPFKQVFRELYLVTAAEKEEGNLSRRYAGQQVNPRQALALFTTRGWVTHPEEGVYKTFHRLGISARVGFLQGMFTPAEVEGLTLETIAFTQRGEWLPLPLVQIPAPVFSEVMRDLDLVVSVAHAGGVDPEASASSLEAREALILETCSLLDLHNVRVKDRHVLVDGKLGHYTIHLGSAVVHKQPGGSVCIIPVHSQQRGRLFLPFVDNDPKTAEIVSKVVLLAKDSEIRDPTILEQILN